jgi:hypothetical protein
MYRNVKLLALALATLFFSVPAPVYGLDSLAAKAAFQFLEDPVVPRLIAMGGAGAAFGGGGFSFVNPAQPLLAEEPYISIGYAPMPGDLDAPFFETAWFFPGFFAGVYASNHSISGIVPTTEQGPNYQVDPFSYSFSLVSLDVGYKRDRVALALTVNGMQERIETSTRYGVSVSVGALYRVIPGKLTAGLALFNEGTATAFTCNVNEQGQREPLPRSARLGIAYSDTLKTFPVNVACDVVYRDVGDKVQAAKNIVPRITAPVGIEVWPTSYVAVRLGKRINFETEVINFGAGLRFQPLTFDMAFVVSQLERDVEVKPMFGLTYAIASSPQAPAQKLVMPPVNVTDTSALQKTGPAIAPVSEALKTPVDSAHAVAKADSSSIKGAIQHDTLQTAPANAIIKTVPADSVKTLAPVEQKASADSIKKDSADIKASQPQAPIAPEKPAQKN